MSSRQRITEVLKTGAILVSDGAWGTSLQNKGLVAGECPELWCLNRPADVLDVASQYIIAGADMIESNTFGGTRYKLEHYGLADRAAEINRAGVGISRQAAGNDKRVIASVGPTGKILMMGEVTEEELVDAFREQIVAMEAGGADAVCIETMSAIDEACCAIRAAKESTSLEIICTFTFELTVQNEFRTMMGVSPADAANACAAAGAHIIGTNCGNGMERMVRIVSEMRAAQPGLPILVHANAGKPELINGADVFPETPEDMARQVPSLIRAGVNIIGGCCGTTPAHIRAIKQAVIEYVNREN